MWVENKKKEPSLGMVELNLLNKGHMKQLDNLTHISNHPLPYI